MGPEAPQVQPQEAPAQSAAPNEASTQSFLADQGVNQPEPMAAPEPAPDMMQGIEQPFFGMPDLDIGGMFADGGAVQNRYERFDGGQVPMGWQQTASQMAQAQPQTSMTTAQKQPASPIAPVTNPGFAYGGEVSDALRLAKHDNLRLHQEVARHGYATEGAVEPEVQAEGEVSFAPEYAPRPVEQPHFPDEASQEAFIKEQTAGSAPQYDPRVETGLKNAGLAATKWTPPGAVADAAGLLGNPSLYQNVKEGRYLPAALQVASVGLPAALAGRAAIAAGLGAGASKFTKLGKPDVYGMPGYIGYQTAEDWGPSVLGKETYEGAKKAGKAALEKGTNYIKSKFGYADGGVVNDAMALATGGGAWTRKEGQDPAGGLNAKGRASAKAEGHNLKPPAPHPKTEKDAGRRKSFCSRMKGMRSKLTSAETANDPDSRINKSLRAWNCADGGAVDDAMRLAKGGEVWEKPRPKSLGKPKHLSESQKASAKASAKAAGRPYPSLVDNINAAKRGK
jgi:hypothetical protein